MAGDTFVIIGLRRKYAELKGRVRYTADCWDEGTLESVRQVGCVLRLFSPGEDLSAIKPKRPYKGARARHWTRSAMDVLRRANGPLTARQIANRIAKDQGITEARVIASIECSLHSTLERREGLGITRAEGSPKRWAVE